MQAGPPITVVGDRGRQRRSALCSLEDDLLAVWGDIKSRGHRNRAGVSELALGAVSEVQEPEILVFDSHRGGTQVCGLREEGDVAGAAREG